MSKTPKVIAVAAHSENGIIGRDGGLPWRVKGDFQFWLKTAHGKPIIMGRKTLMDVMPKFRRDEHLIVLTRNTDFTHPDVDVVHDINDAFDMARTYCAAHDIDEIIIGGGEEIYRLALPFVDEMYLSTIHTVVDGDARFPNFDESDWDAYSTEHFEAQEGDTCGFTLRKYKRL